MRNGGSALVISPSTRLHWSPSSMCRRDHGNRTSMSTYRDSSASLPVPFHPAYYFISVITRACFRSSEMLFPVCYSLALDLIVYLPHLYSHNPQPTSVIGHIYCTGICLGFTPRRAITATGIKPSWKIDGNFTALTWATGFQSTPPERSGAEVE